MTTDNDHHARLVAALKNPANWPGQIEEITTLETHISTVFLVGDYAYKLKKPLDLGFLDFSTLEKRRFCCEEEVRLNGRLAPQIYLAAVPLSGTPEQPLIEGEGDPIDWMVKMHRFTASDVLAGEKDRLDAGLIKQITQQIAVFHGQAAHLGPDMPFGSPEAVFQPMQENFDQLRGFTDDPAILSQLEPLEQWTQESYARLTPLLQQRHDQGHIRECHGDLHLGNIVLEQGEPIIFDGIEFSPGLRWIDTLNDLAFLLMDLTQQGRPDLADIALNHYLELSGDYAGLPLLTFFQTYRAMVRAKVTAIRLGQPGLPAAEREQVQKSCLDYLQLAARFTEQHSGHLLITHGLSGSGKSHLSADLPGRLPLIHVRSDIERKRLAGIGITERTGAGLDQGLYSAEMTERTYSHLETAAEAIITSGRHALIDATFLKNAQRVQFKQLAERLNAPFLIVGFEMPEADLEQRILQRNTRDDDASDADLGVLEAQIAGQEALTAEERTHALTIDQSRKDAMLALVERVKQH